MITGMMKAAAVSILAASLLFTAVSCQEESAPIQNEVQQPTVIADHTAAVNFDTSSEKAIIFGMRGVNNENTHTNIIHNDPNLINQVNTYGRLGYVRWPGGTNINVFNWKTGAMDEEYLGQFSKQDDAYYTYTVHKRSVETKGYEKLADFRDFVQRTGARAMITVNVAQYTPDEAGDLAKYCKDNNIPVIYFELGNEIMYFTAESGNNVQHYITGTDYVNRMRAYDSAIKAAYPGAKTIIAMSNKQSKEFDEDLFNYENPFWDGVTFHRFKGDGATFDAAMKSGNSALDEWLPLINDYYAAKFSNKSTPIYIGEHGVALKGTLASTQYHGVYVSESILRLSQHSNISYLGGYRLIGGVFEPANFHRIEMEEAYEDNVTLDTRTLNFEPYYSAPSVSLKVVDEAVNNSSAIWTTTVTGGSTVQKEDGSNMPSLYAQAYKGENGKNYVVITNKSAQTHNVTIKMDGTNVTSSITKTYTTHTDPAAINNTSKKTNINIQSGSTSNPVFVPAYSVMRIEWDSGRGVAKPQSPWVTNADPANGEVALKWLPTPNAAGYKVKYGTTSGTYTNTVNVNNVTSYNVTGLANGTIYYFIITASNGAGESAVSNEVAVKLAAPEAPVITEIFPEKSGRVGVKWQSVPGTTGYRVKYGTASGSYTSTIDVGNMCGYIVEELENDQAYYFVVSAYNAMGESINSSQLSETPKAGLPLAPYDLRITSQSATSAELEWKPAKTQTYITYFENGAADGWSTEAGTWSVIPHPGSKRSTNVYKSPASGRSISILNNNDTDDYEGEANIEVPVFGKSHAGVIARYTDSNNYYRFVYNSANDDFRLIKVLDGEETTLVSRTRAKLGISSTADMTFFISVTGSLIECKLNNLGTVMSKTDSSLPTGKFGVYSNNQEALYDCIRIRRNNAAGYNIYRSKTSATGPYTLIRSGETGTVYTDNTLEAGAAYFYRVTAVNSDGESYGHSNTYKKE